MNGLSRINLLVLLACALAALLPKTPQDDCSTLALENGIKEIDYDNMSFKEMEKAIQNLFNVATNSFGNTSINTSDRENNNSDRKLVVAIAKRLANLMTRAPKRCVEMVNCKEVSDTHAIVLKTRLLLSPEGAPFAKLMENEAFAKLIELDTILFKNYTDLRYDCYHGIRTCDHGKILSDLARSLEYVLKVLHSINFDGFSYDKLISFAQLLIDVSKFTGLHEDEEVLNEEVLIRETEMEMKSFHIDNDREAREIFIEKDDENMSFKAMKKAIQNLSIKLKQETNELKDTSNSSRNSNEKSAGPDDNPDRKLVATITKRLVGYMTRSPKRCIEWLKCNRVAEKGLGRAHTLVTRVRWFLPSESEATGKMREMDWLLFNSFNLLGNANNTFDIKRRDHGKMITDSVRSVEYVLQIIQTINFAEFSYDKLISFAQLLLDVIRFAGLHDDDEKVFEEELTIRNTNKISIEKAYGSYSMGLISIAKSVHLAPMGTSLDRLSNAFRFLAQAVKKYAFFSPHKDAIMKKIQSIVDEEAVSKDYMQKTNELRNIQYNYYQNEEPNSSQTCMTALSYSTNSSMESVGTEDCRKGVTALTKGLADAMGRTPKCCKEWLKCDEVAERGLRRAATLAESAQSFLPFESEAIGKLREIGWRLYRTCDDLSKANNYDTIETSDHAKKISLCVGLVKDVLKIIHSINFAEFSYERMISFSQFLTDVIRFAGLREDEDKDEDDDEDEELLKEELVTLKTEIDMNNIEKTYGSYSLRLLSILKSVLLSPQGTDVDKLSDAFQFLVQAVEEYAILYPKKDIIIKKIQSITEEETKLCNVWQNPNSEYDEDFSYFS